MHLSGTLLPSTTLCMAHLALFPIYIQKFLLKINKKELRYEIVKILNKQKRKGKV